MVPGRIRVRPGVLGLVVAGFGLILAGAATWYLFSGTAAASNLPSTDFSAIPASVNYDAPTIELRDLEGAQHSLSDYAGHVVLVNLWATWCPPCAAEMPNLQHFYERHRDEGLTVVAIDDGDPRESVEVFVTEHRLTFPVWLDPTYEATDRAFKTSNLPSSYVVDRAGRIRLLWFGAISEANLEKYVGPLLKE
jgi:peroxiredoxin